MRGGTRYITDMGRIKGISIHPPREGWDQMPEGAIYNFWVISIHPPREGWDPVR